MLTIIFGQFWAVEISGQFVFVLSIGTADSTLRQKCRKGELNWFLIGVHFEKLELECYLKKDPCD